MARARRSISQVVLLERIGKFRDKLPMLMLSIRQDKNRLFLAQNFVPYVGPEFFRNIVQRRRFDLRSPVAQCLI